MLSNRYQQILIEIDQEHLSPLVVIGALHQNGRTVNGARVIATTGSATPYNGPGIVPVQEQSVSASTPRPLHKRTRLGKSGLSTDELLAKSISDGPKSKHYLGIIFEKDGFNRTSINGPIARALKNETIMVDENDIVRRAFKKVG